MASDDVQAYLQHLYGASMEAAAAARPILRRLFFLYATRDGATEVPTSVMEQAAPAMSAMHRALERGEYAEALAQLKVWARLPGLDTRGSPE